MTTITRIWAREVLDSRGNPTVEAEVTLAGGGFAVGSAIRNRRKKPSTREEILEKEE